eukprot:6214818-Pleurochrysis_carterae.AAC.4
MARGTISFSHCRLVRVAAPREEEIFAAPQARMHALKLANAAPLRVAVCSCVPVRRHRGCGCPFRRDRQAGLLSFTIDAYGESDLRAACESSFVVQA